MSENPPAPWAIPFLPPRVRIWELPEQEREAASFVDTNLGGMAKHCSDFASAVALFDHATMLQAQNAHPSAHDWLFIAARDGAMTLFHFVNCMTTAQSLIFRYCPTLATVVDRPKLKNAGKMFQDSFPDARSLRHAVAHVAEIMATPEAFQANALQKGHTFPGLAIPPGNLFMGNLIGRRFTTTHEGELLQYEVSSRSVDKLKAIRNEIYSALFSTPSQEATSG